MIIGVPKEIKTKENRVAITPEGVSQLVGGGHKVIVEVNAGIGSGFKNEQYKNAGAIMEKAAQDIWSKAEMIVKVKEPIQAEFDYFRPGLVIFTYLHLAANYDLTQRLLEDRITSIAYETIELHDGSLPLLRPMSEIAGRIGAQEAAVLLERHNGGKGLLMGCGMGVPPARVAVLGGGISGKAAAEVAIGMGADVTIFEVNKERIKSLSKEFDKKCVVMLSSPENIQNVLSNIDILIGCVLIPGAKSPKVITRKMLALMETGSVLVDIAIDQGGCFETSRPTTHENPTFMVDGILHYCVTNMPGAVPRTSTLALSNATLPWVRKISAKNSLETIINDSAICKGLNTYNGHITCRSVAETFNMDYYSANELYS